MTKRDYISYELVDSEKVYPMYELVKVRYDHLMYMHEKDIVARCANEKGVLCALVPKELNTIWNMAYEYPSRLIV